jgi:predicted hotdog family 3-hydroxylacyl-ACP dehydratase
MFPDVEKLLPHRPPMVWIDTLIRCDDTSAAATACFDSGHFAVGDGALIESALIECLAQTAAAAAGERARTRGNASESRGGMLAAVSNFRILAQPPLGKTLLFDMRELKRFGVMLLISGTVTCEGQPIATGELTLYA